MKQNFQRPARCVYPMMQIVIHAEQPLLLLLGGVGSLQLRTGVLCRAASLVQEVPQVWDATLLRAVAGALDGVVDG